MRQLAGRALVRAQRPSSRRGSPAALCAVWVCALASLWAPHTRADIDDDVARAKKQIQLLESKTALVETEYLSFKQAEKGSRYFEERLNDGQSLMLLKDYVRAAIIFHDLVDGGRYRDHPGFPDALYNLGEALFFNKNYIDARSYYRGVIESERGKPYRRLAMVRLMQIALNTNDFDKVDEYHDRLVQEAISPEGQYLWGKTLFMRNRMEDAHKVFSSLQPGQPYFLQARYYLGVVLIRQGKLEEALAIYDDLVRQPTRREKEKDVVDLAHMARGRLLHDLGREEKALDAFQAIPHTSIHFDDALIEICWTYVKIAERAEAPEERKRWFTEAFRTLEILEVSTPDSTLVPRARLMKGHIMEKMGDYEKAVEIFGAVSSSYSSIKKELDDLIARHEDPVRYFNEIAGKNLESFDLSAYLPPVAVKWMSRQEEMSAALGVMKDIDVGRRFVKEARSLLKKLDTLLADKRDRINLFPLLREGAKRTIEVDNARVILERNLAHLEERVVMEYLSASERRAIEKARRDRETLEKKIEGLPTTRKAMDTREDHIRRRIEGLEQSVYQSSIALKGMKAQLTAMDEWLREHEKELAGREEAVRDFREEIRRGWAMANQLQKDLDHLNEKLVTERARAGLASEAQSKEEQLRREYSDALALERKLAEQIHERLGPEGTAHIAAINEMRLRSDKLRRKLVTIRGKLDAMVDVEAKKLVEQAAEERRNLESYEAALAKLEKESEMLAGEVAYKALEEVRQRFYRLVLDADVGILDVAWGRKQSTTKKISELGRKLGAERKRLYEEFKGVLNQVN
ncbi:MAG: tetratricopeptide repeat protein [Deltaproteobacteria bacterium]|nr:tetratricopeptide repeat protein [Deltaproteobacteria bacterium]